MTSVYVACLVWRRYTVCKKPLPACPSRALCLSTKSPGSGLLINGKSQPMASLWIPAILRLGTSKFQLWLMNEISLRYLICLKCGSICVYVFSQRQGKPLSPKVQTVVPPMFAHLFWAKEDRKPSSPFTCRSLFRMVADFVCVRVFYT